MRCQTTSCNLVLALLSFATGCSPAPMPVSQSSTDPSSPTAPEGVSPTVLASVHAGHVRGSDDARAKTAADTVVYACPMHPEVTATKPGETCPKCSMKLVPQK